MTILVKPIITHEHTENWFLPEGGTTVQAYVDYDYYYKAAVADSDFFYRLQNRIPLLDLPYKLEKHIVNMPIGTYRRYSSSYGWGPKNNVNYMSMMGAVGYQRSSFDESDVTDLAITDYYESVNNARSGNLGVSLAELKETVGFIGSTATRIATAMRAFRKGRFKDGARALGVFDGQSLKGVKFPSGRTYNSTRQLRKHLYRERRFNASKKSKADLFAGAWMEYKYAWTPLFLDVYDMAKSAALLQSTPTFDIYYKGMAKTILTNKWGSGAIGDGTNAESNSVACLITQKLIVDNVHLRTLNTLGLVNPLVVAWELVPFSFVWDWWHPIGPYLQSLSAHAGLKWVEGTVTITHKASGNGSLKSTNWRNQYSGIYWSGSYVRMERKTRYQIPNQSFPPYDLGGALGVSHTVTALSLFQLLRPK